MPLKLIDTTAVPESELENKIKTQIYPIPFTKEVYIKRPEGAVVKVYDLSGRYINDVKENKWNFRDKHGNKVKKGVYFFEINHKGKKEIRKGVYLGN